MTTVTLIRGDARHVPLADASVDLVVTSPPYFALRSYSDNGEHYADQIGSEPAPQEYLDSLIQCTSEWMRVLKPSGSIFVNLGDKYVADNRGSGTDIKRGRAKHAPVGPAGFVGLSMARQKSLMDLPWRYSIRCVDELGLIKRAEIIWDKPSALPESTHDRVQRSHEVILHFVKQPRYYSAIDAIRKPHAAKSLTHRGGGESWGNARNPDNNWGAAKTRSPDPLGALPDSVWTVASQPLNVPGHISHTRCCNGHKKPDCQGGLDHYAAFPFALVRPIILGWSPRHVCTACSEGRRPVMRAVRPGSGTMWGRSGRGVEDQVPRMHTEHTDRTLTGYACACSDTTEPSTPGVVLDPFGGTAAAPLVAAMNGRTGISIDASWDYSDIIARWRINDPKERARAAGLDADAVARIPVVDPRQGSLLDLLGGAAS